MPACQPPQGPAVQQKEHTRQGDEHGLGHQPERERHRHHRHAPARGTDGVPGIGRQCGHPEERGQDVFALRDPRHRFDVQRVQGKHGRHKGTAPDRRRHARQQQEQHHRAQRVNHHVDDVMSSGGHAKQGHVQHVGEPGQWMPVRRVPGGEGPPDTVQRQSALHVRVFGDVGGIVELDEAELVDRKIRGARHDHQQGHHAERGRCEAQPG